MEAGFGEMRLGVVVSFFVYLSYFVLIVFGHVNDFIDRLFRRRSKEEAGYPPLMSDFEAFYTRRLYSRIQDCWNRPIVGVPGPWMGVMKRTSRDETWKTDLKVTGEVVRCLNLGSYNYLGFASNEGPVFEGVVESVKKYGISTVSPYAMLGRTALHRECEKNIAEFVGKPDAIVFGMGYEANSTTIPALVQPGDLIVSDGNNHASVVYGCRLSGASVRVFKHNDANDLERVVRDAICRGHPRLHRPWRRILIVVEGVYSMEGVVCNLPEIVRIKNKYRCYLFVDEAHSIGAMGMTGRGVCEYYRVSPRDVDVLMGTFTKSFASVGGYVAAEKPIIDFLRFGAYSSIYETSLAPGAARQVLGALACIRGLDVRKGLECELNPSVCAPFPSGHERLSNLRKNVSYVRRELQRQGFRIMGCPDSPIIPVMVYFPGKLPAISRACFEKGIAIVVVGFPATQLLGCRIRLCISAAHTIRDLKWAIGVLNQIGKDSCIKYGMHSASLEPRKPKLSISLVKRVE
ncbi:serine palmitoyltransferase 2-like isoform X1 [Schistocerca gregaria]|uniref:serine palmitoyltransferase 2-like isoform X1 n=1 Tax=Schistocerca gregaria TaxID=7010 RepID=UPI00211DDDC9|nr:serine palmitoyltransferase 2-like isoform X1 [Schistocerca gregaria]